MGVARWLPQDAGANQPVFRELLETDKTVIEARTGVGYASRGFDFIAAEARLTHAPSDQLAISLGLGVADFQEATFSATAWRAEAHRGGEYKLTIYSDLCPG